MRVAVIPARGGSKRIPHKNIRPFAGKPIIAYPLRAARASGLFDRVIVSTDDPQVASVAREYGGETPFPRPATLADDFTGTNAVVKHALMWLATQGVRVEYACCIYATAPFLRVGDLQQGYEKLLATGKSFAFSVTTFPFPIQRSVRINADGTVDAFFPEFINSRSQDLEEAYHDAGQFYWGRTEAFMSDAIVFSRASIPVVLPRHLVQDIDTLEDWHRAELMFKAWQLEEKGTGL
jgi:N-acylneuraminate cytidylyltransferase